MKLKANATRDERKLTAQVLRNARRDFSPAYGRKLRQRLYGAQSVLVCR